jgi:hypothetical protein
VEGLPKATVLVISRRDNSSFFILPLFSQSLGGVKTTTGEIIGDVTQSSKSPRLPRRMGQRPGPQAGKKKKRPEGPSLLPQARRRSSKRAQPTRQET